MAVRAAGEGGVESQWARLGEEAGAEEALVAETSGKVRRAGGSAQLQSREETADQEAAALDAP